ncbi:MAG: hypothetical protein QG591_1066 [Planctomycetota bacterium]|jgi:hypothetical protein|nr:hypothetical protein [Planctomycetota bacterium]
MTSKDLRNLICHRQAMSGEKMRFVMQLKIKEKKREIMRCAPLRNNERGVYER